MRPAREWIVLIILLLFLNWTYYGSYACLKEERDALLQIKAWFGPHRGNGLSSWVDKDDDADCCKWDSVTCNNTTKRVINSLGGVRDSKLGDLYLNTSLFRDLKELKSLDLSGNQLVCCSQGTGAFSLELRNLEILNLDTNHLNDNILPLLRGAHHSGPSI
ncbi:hypothetical protein Tsubulata_018289 [Turnera subulata]|uniref:Leucine-rich repeat-containing N-terminal plant-type domain-containing protein n=1 Tax=Turnera subulata TaxID=218843 RepID=A0A9Q0JL84_9ROSI|nr:hypothetical protein Tsubulata_018289 [Turnera subulata]